MEDEVELARKRDAEIKMKTENLMKRARHIFARVDVHLQGSICRDDVSSIFSTSALEEMFSSSISLSLEQWELKIQESTELSGKIEQTESLISELESSLNKSERMKRLTQHREEEKAKKRAKSLLAEKRFRRERAESVR